MGMPGVWAEGGDDGDGGLGCGTRLTRAVVRPYNPRVSGAITPDAASGTAQKWWGLFGKVAAVLASLWVLMQIWTWLSPSGPELVVSAYPHPHVYSPTTVSQADGFWSMVVENAGDAPCKDIRISVENALDARIIRHGGTLIQQGRIVGPVVVIDELYPSENCTVHVWTDIDPTAIPEAKHVTAAHSSGEATVTVFRPVGPIFLWLSQHWFLVIWLAVGPVLFSFAGTRIFELLTRKPETSSAADAGQKVSSPSRGPADASDV
jgi:hypothetical protein